VAFGFFKSDGSMTACHLVGQGQQNLGIDIGQGQWYIAVSLYDVQTYLYMSIYTYGYTYTSIYTYENTRRNFGFDIDQGQTITTYMGWLRSVGSIKLQVSFAEYSLFKRALLQRRPIILSILLIEATP